MSIILASETVGCVEYPHGCEQDSTCPPDAADASAGSATDAEEELGDGTIDGQGEMTVAGDASDALVRSFGDADPACDPNADPATTPCVIHEAFGVFVAATTGNDAYGNGTRAHPFATIGKGIAVAKSSTRRVYVCADSNPYGEAISVLNDADGLAVYGAFACTDWTYSTTNRARVIPSTPGVAWRVENLLDGMLMQDIAVVARDATSPGGSSIAMIVQQSEGIRLRRVSLTAGNGAMGAAGLDGSTAASGSQPGAAQAGSAASCSVPPVSLSGGTWTGFSNCEALGGAGGPSLAGADGASGTAGQPDVGVVPSSVDNGGTGSGQPGGPGAVGLSGDVGEQGPGVGQLTSAGYSPAPGGDGKTGRTGQGGGGGSASSAAHAPMCIGASGGAGGMGGCGGNPGKGGQGGGASVALLSWSSGVILDGCTLSSGQGGDGGDGGRASSGGAGSVGGPGGFGYGNVIQPGGGGGLGGNGGDGGSGAGGTGGPSLVVAFHDREPSVLDGTVLAAGRGGAGGKGGALQIFLTTPAPGGPVGVSASRYAQP